MWYNPLVNWLLRSPLHRLLDGSTLLLTYAGRKSGRAYTLPLSYAQNGQRLRLITRRQKAWWKSIAAGAPVNLWLRGEQRPGWATAVPAGREDRIAALLTVYRGMPRRLAEQQEQDVVLVEIELQPAAVRESPPLRA
jgi:hypothetical protein